MALIPPFPHFRPITLADRGAIEDVTSCFPPSSDFNFTGLWAWDTGGQGAIAMLGGNLVFRLKDYTGDQYFYTFLGQDHVVEACATLLDHARQVGLRQQLWLIPEEIVTADPCLRQHFIVDEDRDNFDYIYAAEDWALLPASRFSTHRKMSRLYREQETLAWRRIDPADPACQLAITEIFRRWAEQTSPEATEQDQPEGIALQRLFAMPGDDRLAACGAFDGDRLVGFTIWETLPGGDGVVVHFQKADRAYKGLSSWQAHTLGQHLVAEGHRFLNAEQDLGIPGLRAHKLSLRPTSFLRKYIISERKVPQ